MYIVNDVDTTKSSSQVFIKISNGSLYTEKNRLIRSEKQIKNIKGVEHLIEEPDQEYKKGGALQVKKLLNILVPRALCRNE